MVSPNRTIHLMVSPNRTIHVAACYLNRKKLQLLVLYKGTPMTNKEKKMDSLGTRPV